MPPVSTKELIRYTPDNLKEREDVPVFLIKTPTLRDKIALDACLAVEGVRYPSDSEYAVAMKDGIRQQVIDEDQPMLLAYVDEWEGVREEGNVVDTELAERIDHIAKVLRPFHRPLAQIEADRGRFLAMAMLVRAEMFLMDIEGVDAPKLERRSGRLTEPCQEAIEEKYGTGVLFGIGARTVVLTTPTEDEIKNSELLEPSQQDPEISMVDPVQRTGRRGKFLGNGTNATPA